MHRFQMLLTSLQSVLSNMVGKESKKKPTPLERKQQLRKIYRKCRDQGNEALRRSAAISILTENQSLRRYDRKRKREYMERPAKRSKPKSHIPNFDKIEWDKEKVLEDLRNHPRAPPTIN